MRLKSSLPAPLAVALNLAMVYVAYWLCRLAYWAENAAAFEGFWSHNTLRDIFVGAWMFDTSAIMYSNVLYVVLVLLPQPIANRSWWKKMAHWLFVVVNSVAIIMNLGDAVYFQYTGRRTTSTVFLEFANEGNLLQVFGVELLRHWYLVAIALVIMAMFWRGYRHAGGRGRMSYVLRGLSLLAFIPLCIIGMRGGATTAVRPITISNANQYVERPAEAALILNTPFAIFRTLGTPAFVTPGYFSSKEELERVYTPEHKARPRPQTTSLIPDPRPSPLPLPCREGSSHHLTADEAPDPQKVYTPLPTREGQGGGSGVGLDSGSGSPNIIIIIVESFGREYIGALNKPLDGGTYRGYTPFVDSLCREGATFEWSFCNGRKSIDAMPSILSGIPMFIEPFFLTPASMNDVGGIAAELGTRGYETAFFHGAENGSMGFQAFARKTGFRHYFGRTEYNADPRFSGDADFDGMWAIWDEPFLQFMAMQLTDLREPFLASVFTASSHHPYAIPEAYRDTFPEEGIIIHKCIRYTDHALRRFFQTARRQPWFDRTLFVLTSDHTNLSDHAFYQTDIGGFCSPIIFYDPSARLITHGRRKGIAQHTDIFPTLMGILGSDRPFVAFGKDLFATPPDSTWAVNYNNGIYQYARNGLLLQFDGTESRALYALSDSLLQRNLLGKRPEQPHMERQLKAIIQQYMSRMNENRLTPSW